MIMQVEFYTDDERRVCGWVATPPNRRPFQGSTMAAGRDLPHDLVQFTIEHALDVRDGFWGLLAHGGSFPSVPGRRPTRDGLALVRAHRTSLMSIEVTVGRHYAAWKRGEPTPLTPALDVMYARWLALRSDARLTVEWPVHPLPGARTTAPLGRGRVGKQPSRR